MNKAEISVDTATSKEVAIINERNSLQETHQDGKFIKKSPKHVCNICNKQFVRRSVLLRHSKIHLNIKPFRCKFCERKFLRKDNFATHMKSILAHNFECGCDRCCIHFCFHLIHDQSLENNESKSLTYQCSMCAETFRSIPDSKNHFFKTHKEEAKLLLQYNQSYFAQKLLNGSSKLLSCIICEQKFSTTKMMEEHKCEKDSAVIIIALDMDLDTPPQNDSYADILEKFDSADNYSKNNKLAIKEKVTVSNDLENEEPYPDKTAVTSLDNENTLYYCEVCNKKLKSQEAKLAHEMMHKHGFHKNIPCGVCSRVFCEYSKLVRHIFVHTGSKPFRCKSCCKGFNQRFQLTNHEIDCLKKSTISAKANSEILKQTDCETIKQTDTENMKQINNEVCIKVPNSKTKSRKGLDCHICHKYIADHSKMVRHLRSHSGPKPYACKYCFRRFAKMEHLRIHEDAYCSVKPQDSKVTLLEKDDSEFSPHTSLKKGIPCKVCKKSFTEYSKLIKHMQSHYSTQKLNNQCNDKESLKSDDKQMDFLVLEPQTDKHSKDIPIEDSKIVVGQSLDDVNEDGKVFCCKICGKTLSSKEAEMAHEMMHKHGCNKNIPCGICKTPFPEYSKLVRHLIKHTGSKPFTCKYCSKRFAHKCHLSCHEVAYCLKKPKEERSEFSSQPSSDKKCLQCYICYKRFAEQSKLIRHLKTHSGSKAFGCQYCPARFSKKSYLSIHERTNCMLRLIHKGLVEKNEDYPDSLVSCKACDKKFYCYEDMKQHLLSHSSTKSVGINSSNRNTDFSQIELFEDLKDANQDDGNKPYMCQPCRQSFCTESELTNHIAIHHESSQPFTCCLCEVEFEFGDMLSSHFDQFHTQNNLLFQSLLDTNNPIRCNLCQITFLSLAHFHTHVVATHPDKKAINIH